MNAEKHRPGLEKIPQRICATDPPPLPYSSVVPANFPKLVFDPFDKNKLCRILAPISSVSKTERLVTVMIAFCVSDL